MKYFKPQVIIHDSDDKLFDAASLVSSEYFEGFVAVPIAVMSAEKGLNVSGPSAYLSATGDSGH